MYLTMEIILVLLIIISKPKKALIHLSRKTCPCHCVSFVAKKGLGLSFNLLFYTSMTDAISDYTLTFAQNFFPSHCKYMGNY